MSKSRDAFRTISEVADWLETPAHVLRFWESKFSQVKPVKRAGGRRYYRPADMELLGGIKKLLHEDGMTIKGVQKVLREQGVRHVCSLSAMVGAEDDDIPDAALIEDAPFEEVAEAPATSEILTFPTSATARPSPRQPQTETPAAGETGAPPLASGAVPAASGTDRTAAGAADTTRSEDSGAPVPATTDPATALDESAQQPDPEETGTPLEDDQTDRRTEETREAPADAAAAAEAPPGAGRESMVDSGPPAPRPLADGDAMAEQPDAAPSDASPATTEAPALAPAPDSPEPSHGIEAGEDPVPAPQSETAPSPAPEDRTNTPGDAATPVGRTVDLPDFTAQAEATQVPGPLTHLARIGGLTKPQAQALAAPLDRMKALRDRLNRPLP
ncbi:MerR family transcriptional regulator [Ponticoccus sp. (in: a-proteobacteria)]|uniref:MerR family transcriptional regulator n=1 Tax=Ponticoccus sp. (in: a-proteobacteria) TaxID=1925025 RepID=UPI003AB90F36